jgi:hypothetical protein
MNPDESNPRMTKADREQLIRLGRLRAKQAERETEAREKILLAEVEDLLTAEYEARDQLWDDATLIAEDAAAKANAQIQAACVDLGIPAKDAPSLKLGWASRGEFTNSQRRAELRKLAMTRLTALTKAAKAAINDKLLEVETELIAGSLQSGEATTFLANSMPSVEALMPPLNLNDLGVVRWQPPEDAAAQLTTPLTPPVGNAGRCCAH